MEYNILFPKHVRSTEKSVDISEISRNVSRFRDSQEQKRRKQNFQKLWRDSKKSLKKERAPVTRQFQSKVMRLSRPQKQTQKVPQKKRFSGNSEMLVNGRKDNEKETRNRVMNLGQKDLENFLISKFNVYRPSQEKRPKPSRNSQNTQTDSPKSTFSLIQRKETLSEQASFQ